MTSFHTQGLSVGYGGKALIKDIDIEVHEGEILCLIGPNGSGKSTILKSITRRLAAVAGTVYVGEDNLHKLSRSALARRMSVMLTERVEPELMTCEEVVAVGRYAYTNRFGSLTSQDKEIIRQSLEKVNALELKDSFYTSLSDGQRQRILLARALCQQPKVLVLDEPTSYLDIRHKIELMQILRQMCLDEKLTVVLSLHEVDMAAKLADTLVLIHGEHVFRAGAPEDILDDDCIRQLYDIHQGTFDMALGSMELPRTQGKSRAFVLGGNGNGAGIYRALQKRGVAFSTGIIWQNDVDYYVARHLAQEVFSIVGFEMPDEVLISRACDCIRESSVFLDSGVEIGTLNAFDRELMLHAQRCGVPIVSLRTGGMDGVSGRAVESVRDMMDLITP